MLILRIKFDICRKWHWFFVLIKIYILLQNHSLTTVKTLLFQCFFFATNISPLFLSSFQLSNSILFLFFPLIKLLNSNINVIPAAAAFSHPLNVRHFSYPMYRIHSFIWYLQHISSWRNRWHHLILVQEAILTV